MKLLDFFKQILFKMISKKSNRNLLREYQVFHKNNLVIFMKIKNLMILKNKNYRKEYSIWKDKLNFGKNKK